MTSRLRKFLAAAVLMLAAAPSAAQDIPVPAKVHAPLLLKVLAFDRLLATRVGSELNVAVVFQSGNRASVAARDDFLRYAAGAGSTLRHIAVKVSTIDLDATTLHDALAGTRMTALYITPLRAVDIATIATEARLAGATTLTGVARYVSLGLAVGVGVQRDRPKLLINLAAAKLEGADFSAELLKLAEIIK